MKASTLLEEIKKTGIKVFSGVPDSTLKIFCDGLQAHKEDFSHYVAVNEGAAVGLAVGTYLSTQKPACVYMQNSGIGNSINPLASLANNDVYGIPILLLVGWRGEPGTKDEPQHVFQGKVTCKLFEVMDIPYSIMDEKTTDKELADIMQKAELAFGENKQYAIIIKKGTFEKEYNYTWDNGYSLNREQVLNELMDMLPKDARIVSTTGKISRELYEICNAKIGGHDSVFMTVGGMGHASMIALAIADNMPQKQIVCIDGDGAALMHMGAIPFIASHAPQNFIHIILNNQAHESVGAMPTDCQKVSFAEIAKVCGYKMAKRISSKEELGQMKADFNNQVIGPVLYEIMVSLDSRKDLGRPKETAEQNKIEFMKNLMVE